MVKQLALKDIQLDGGTQPRSSLCIETVEEYVAALSEGSEFPAAIVYFDGTNYWLADGFHRFHAHRKLGRLEIAADVRKGSRRDAILFAAGANATHGLRRSNLDKRYAVTLLLNDAEWSQWSDRRIAEQCGVSNNFVATVRRQVSSNDTSAARSTPARVGRDGKTYALASARGPASEPQSVAGHSASSAPAAATPRVTSSTKPGTSIVTFRAVCDAIGGVARRVDELNRVHPSDVHHRGVLDQLNQALGLLDAWQKSLV